ncbi:hypothetical protein [Streptomyces syringium]|uniref:hypothetical protein n=1 Tax=Streptomyces syringium TaxID=76729 RepID=UPI0033B61646
MSGQGREGLPVDRPVTLEEAVEFKKREASGIEAKTWHFYGSYADAFDCAKVANFSPPQGAGEVMVSANGGMFFVWLYF